MSPTYTSFCLRFITFFSLLISSISVYSQATFTSKADGQWIDEATWNCTAGDCVGRKFPGELGIDADVVFSNHKIDLNDAIDITIASLSITNATSDAVLTVSTPATLTVKNNPVDISGVAPSGTTFNATLKIVGTSVATPGFNIVRNQGLAASTSAVSLVVFDDGQLIVSGDVNYSYLDIATASEVTNDIWIGNSANPADGSKLDVSGNINLSMNSVSSDNLSIVADCFASVTVGGNINLTLINGGSSTSIVRLDLRGSSIVSATGDLNLNFNDISAAVSDENVEVRLAFVSSGANNPVLSVNNLNMTSAWNASYFNTYVKLLVSSIMTVNGAIQFVRAGSGNPSAENRIELNGLSSFRLKGDIPNPTQGSFEFIGVDSEIQFLGSGSQRFPKVKASTTFMKVVVNNTSNSDLSLSGATTIATSLTMTKGIVQSTTMNTLTFADNASSNSGDYSSYIKGPVKKLGGTFNNAIVLPVGANSHWAPIQFGTLTNSNSSTIITVQYYDNSYSNTTPNGSFNVSKKEYWDISATGTILPPRADVTLYWKNACFSVITDQFNVKVGKFNGASWDLKASSSSGNACSGGSTDAGSTFSTTIDLNSPLTFVSTSNALPVELSTFNATPSDSGTIKIAWTTKSEYNNSHFLLLKSADGTSFREITNVPGAGTSSITNHYDFIDANPFPGLNYYQLVQVDFDGKQKQSDVIAIRFTSDDPGFAVYPNPVSAGEATIISSTNDSPFKIDRIVSSQGFDVTDNVLIRETSKTAYNIVTKNLPTGFYFIVTQSSSGVNSIKLLVH